LGKAAFWMSSIRMVGGWGVEVEIDDQGDVVMWPVW